MSGLNRREFLWLGLAGIFVSCVRSPKEALNTASISDGSASSPIDNTPYTNPRDFFGDEPIRPHSYLWRDRSVSQNETSDTETASLVIVGGGLSGLLLAHALRDKKPILLEAQSRFGGNARGQSWGGIPFSMGSAYFGKPQAGSYLGKVLGELGILEKIVTRPSEDLFTLGNSFKKGFWSGASDPARAQEFIAVAQYLRTFGNSAPFPEIPITEGTQALVHELDKLSIAQHLAQKFKLHPHLQKYLELYCTTSFAATPGEVSAAAAVNFLASEQGEVAVLPGGNACIAQALYEELQKTAPSNLRAKSLVTRVRNQKNGVEVRYIDGENKSRSIQARAVVMACPKFVAGRILEDLPALQRKAFESVKYRAYVTAHVLLRQKAEAVFYDSMRLRRGTSLKAQQQRTTDFVSANFASPGKGPAGVLSLYRALPYNQGRDELLTPSIYARLQKDFENDLAEDILPALGLTSKVVEGIRLARFGHALPVPIAGSYRTGLPEKLQTPIQDRIYFCHQDNWLSPAVEPIVSDVERLTPKIRRLLA